MAEVKVKKNSQLINYFRIHSRGFGVAIGIFSKKNKRKRVGKETLNIITGYGVRKSITKEQSYATNFSVASKNIKGYKGENYSVPSRNFFLVAAKPHFWANRNYSFLYSFFKSKPLMPDVEKRLGNLGVTVIRSAIMESKNYEPNSPYTVENKGFNKPLVSTGQMRSAIGYKIMGYR